MNVLRRLVVLAVLLLALAAPAQAQPPPGATIHVVQPGETLYSIAERYGVTVEAIALVNGLDNPALITVGQRLIIPAPGSVPGTNPVYVVQPGDSLASIALRFRLRAADVAAANQLVNPANLYVGQSLWLPGTTQPGQQFDGRLIVLQKRETLAAVAMRYGASLAGLRAANDLHSTDYAWPGLRVFVPATPGSGLAALPAPFTAVQLHPLPAAQGDTLSIRVTADRAVTITGSFGDTPLHFVREGDAQWALAGINALAEPGLVPLTLAASGTSGAPVTLDTNVQIAAGNYSSQYLELTPEQCAVTFDPETTTAERYVITSTTTVFTPQRYWTDLFRLPIGGDVTSAFGLRRVYNCFPNEITYHEGLDLRGATGTPVYAPAPGKVVLARELVVRGNAIVIDHGWGVFTGYWHLSKIGVTEGQIVQAGDYLGDVGSTGRSTGSHLHWEVRVMGVPVDARQWTIETMP